MLQRVSALVYKYFFVNVLSFPQDERHPWDYCAHFVVSFALVGVLFGIFLGILALFSPKLPGVISNERAALILASISALLIGALKEWSDWRVGQRDVVGDFTADALGVGLFVLVAFVAMKMTP